MDGQESVPGGTWENDSLETRIMGGVGRDINMGMSVAGLMPSILASLSLKEYFEVCAGGARLEKKEVRFLTCASRVSPDSLWFQNAHTFDTTYSWWYSSTAVRPYVHSFLFLCLWSSFTTRTGSIYGRHCASSKILKIDSKFQFQDWKMESGTRTLSCTLYNPKGLRMHASPPTHIPYSALYRIVRTRRCRSAWSVV